MTDTERALTGLQNLRDAILNDYIWETDQAVRTIDDAIELLKEQQAEIQKAHEEGFHDGYKQALSEMPNIVRCKDCNKRGTSECYVENASGELAFPWIPPDDWYCADGERKG